MSTRRPTMRDVALEAGVGIGTVSRVVNGAHNVSDTSRQQVREAIERLGFQRDEIARSLRPGQSSRTIGLLTGDLTNPFYGRVAGGAVAAARGAGYAMLLGTADEDPAAERRAIDDLLGRRVAGLLVVPDSADHAFLHDRDGRLRVPVVFVDRPVHRVAADTVLLDNEGGAAMATRHLVAQGHERIAVLVAPSYFTTGRRLRGFRRAMRQAGLAVDESLVVSLEQGSSEHAHAAATELLTRPDAPTAFFSTTNLLTEGVVRALGRRRGQVALVGFDDFQLADLLPTPVTVVAGDTELMGRTATTMLLERIDGLDAAPRRVVLPLRLVERGSGELPPR